MTRQRLMVAGRLLDLYGCSLERPTGMQGQLGTLLFSSQSEGSSGGL